MHIFSKKNSSLFLTAAMLIAAASCTQELQENDLVKPSDDVVLTKAVNTPEDALEGNLIVKLSEETVVAGYEGLMSQFSEKVDVISMRPVFPAAVMEDEVARKYDLHRWFRVDFEGVSPERAAARLSEFDAVTNIQFNKSPKQASDCNATGYAPSLAMMASSSLPFNDPMLADQWHYINTGNSLVSSYVVEGGDIAVKDAWRLTGGDPDIIVAICDGPVKYDHPDLAPNMWVNTREQNGVEGKDDDGNGYVDDIYGLNCTTGYGEIDWSNRDESGHGTHVAGVVGAVNSNGTGICGVAGGTGKGDGVRLMSCQIFNGGQSSNDASAVAFYYAAKNGASIAQCSFGWQGGVFDSDDTYKKAYGVEYAAIKYFMDPDNNNSKVLDSNIMIFAAGNDASRQSSYPGALEEVVCVTALGPDLLPAINYTNYGAGCNIAAPGGDYFVGTLYPGEVNRSQVLSTFINTVAVTAKVGAEKTAGHDYAYMQGTSMACPHVSGIAALGLAYAEKLGKKFSREEFISMLLTSVDDIDARLTSGSKPRAIEGGKVVNGDLAPYRKQMGTGAIDTWQFLMAIEGTPSILVETGKSARYDISTYFGGNAVNLTYLGVEIDAESKAALGLASDPEIAYGKLKINPTKVGSGKITVRAIAGPDADGKIDGDAQIGGSEIVRTISVMSRGVAASNGGWM